MERFELDAVCNDGSPVVYYYSAATRADLTHVWVVHQQGGGWCWSESTCADRVRKTPWYTSSRHSAKTYSPHPGSVLDTKGTRFAGAHAVYLRYCTSDGYIGDTDAGGLRFRGRRAVSALFDALHTRHGLGAELAPRVLYSGCSAGARGVMHNLNYVHAQLQALAGENASVVGLLDSALYIDLPTLGHPAATRLSEQAKGVVSYLNASVDPHCAAVLAERWQCLIGEYAIGARTLIAPLIVHAFQFDSFQLTTDLPIDPVTPRQLRALPALARFVSTFRNRTREVLVSLAGSAGVAVLSPACYRHCNTNGAGFSGEYGTVGGISLASVVDGFGFGAAEPPFLLEECSGFACGVCADADPRWLPWEAAAAIAAAGAFFALAYALPPALRSLTNPTRRGPPSAAQRAPPPRGSSDGRRRRKAVLCVLHSIAVSGFACALVLEDRLWTAGLRQEAHPLLYCQVCVSLGYIAVALPVSVHMRCAPEAPPPAHSRKASGMSGSRAMCVEHTLAAVAPLAYLFGQYAGFYVAATGVLLELPNACFGALILCEELDARGCARRICAALLVLTYALCRLLLGTCLAAMSLFELSSLASESVACQLLVGLGLSSFYLLLFLSWLCFGCHILPEALGVHCYGSCCARQWLFFAWSRCIRPIRSVARLRSSAQLLLDPSLEMRTATGGAESAHQS